MRLLCNLISSSFCRVDYVRESVEDVVRQYRNRATELVDADRYEIPNPLDY